MKIVIAPGHSCPLELGACTASVLECDVVLAIARLLTDQLHNKGHEV